MSEKFPTPNANNERDDSVHFTRHSKAKYEVYADAIKFPWMACQKNRAKVQQNNVF